MLRDSPGRTHARMSGLTHARACARTQPTNPPHTTQKKQIEQNTQHDTMMSAGALHAAAVSRRERRRRRGGLPVATGRLRDLAT